MAVEPEVWIVGASQGLGLAMAREAARQGRAVIGMARRESPDPALFAAWRQLDVRDAAAVEDTVAGLYRQGRTPGVIVYMAASVYQGPALGEPEEALRSAMDTNFLGFVRLAQAVAALKPAGRKVRLVAVGSTLGYVGCPSLDAYSASKAALICYARSARPELAAKGVEVLILSPPHMDNSSADLRGPQVFSLDWSARRLLAAAFEGRREHVLGASNRLMVWMSKAAPGLAHRIMHGIGADALARGVSR